MMFLKPGPLQTHCVSTRTADKPLCGQTCVCDTETVMFSRASGKRVPFVTTVIARVMARSAGKCKHLSVEEVCSATGSEGTQLVSLGSFL
jgi:hypothetical protein